MGKKKKKKNWLITKFWWQLVVFNHMPLEEVSLLAGLKAPYLTAVLASPPLQICIDPLALNQ